MQKVSYPKGEWTATAVAPGLGWYVRVLPKENDGLVVSVEELIDHEPTAADAEALVAKWVAAAKDAKVAEAHDHAKTDSVRAFVVNGAKVGWLNSEQRVSIRQSVADKAAAGRTQTTLYLSDGAHVCTTEKALQTLAVLEVYASDCNDAVMRHEAAIVELTTAESVEAYDVAAGFPDMPAFDL